MDRATKKQKQTEASIEHRPKIASAEIFEELWIRLKFEKAWTLD